MSFKVIDKKRQKIKSILEDPFGYVMFLLNQNLMMIDSFFCSIIVKLVAHFWGVQIKKNLKSYGFIYFSKYPRSQILIGENCTFRSKTKANFIGINHTCCLSTHSHNAKIIIGNACGFSGSSISAYQLVKFGNRVSCGANTIITDFDWHTNRLTGQMESETVEIGDNVWLGMNCVVLKGVTIGSNTVVGANSVVVRSLPANVIAAGNPARVLRSLPAKET